MSQVSHNNGLHNPTGQQNSFLQVAGAPVTPITGSINPPTLRHIPPSPETNLNTTGNRNESQEDSYMFLGAGVPQALQVRRGSKDTADSHVSAESGPAQSDSDYGSQGFQGRTTSEVDSTRRSSSRHRPSESKSGGMSVSGFFRRRRDRTASASQAEVEQPFSPPESFSQAVEGYSLREGTDSSFDNSDRVSREEGGRTSVTLGRTSLRRKASTTRSFSKAKQGIDRLALGIEHAFSLGQRNHPDKDISDCETGYNSTDSRTPGVEADNTLDNQEIRAIRRRPSLNQGTSAGARPPPFAALSPASHDIARRNSTLLLQEMSKTGGATSESKKLIVRVPNPGDAAGNLVSPNVSPRLQPAGLHSAQSAPAITEQNRSLQSGMPSSQTFSNMITGPRMLSYGEVEQQIPQNGHLRSSSSVPQSSLSTRAQEKGFDGTAPTRAQGSSFVASSDNETRSPKQYKHSRNRTVAIIPSAAPPEVIPPERKSSRVVREQEDGSTTLGRSRSRTLTVPTQNPIDSASDRATSDGETDTRRRTPKHRGRASESLRTDSELTSRPTTENSSSLRRRFGSTSEMLNGSAIEQSGSEDPYSETPEKPNRGVRRLPIPLQREKENVSEAEIKTERAGHPREKSSADAMRKKRNSEGKASRTAKDRDKDRDGRSSKKDSKRERTFTIPAADIGITSRMTMYWGLMAQQGQAPDKSLRAHTGTLLGNKVYVIGGCDRQGCWRGVCTYNTESHVWARLCPTGVSLPPLRAHTTTPVGSVLYVFGGGDGPTYSNDVWAYHTLESKWVKPNIITPKNSWPLQRRAHTTVQYKEFLVVFGGGNGQAALNDVWALKISDPDELTWEEWKATGDVPVQKGYHTANLIGNKMVVYGGSDGNHSFSDVHVLDLDTMVWTMVHTQLQFSRLSHTATQVGSYLFIVGGHDGHKYAQDVLFLNLVTLEWESKTISGKIPVGRGYHVSVLHDNRLIMFAGYNGVNHFDDLWSLELASSAYLQQVNGFQVDETVKRVERKAA